MRSIFTIVIVFLVNTSLLYAKDNILNRRITYHCTNQPLESVLLQISDLASFTFSYNASILPTGHKISIDVEDESLKSILSAILPNNIAYNTSGNHLILFKSDNALEKEKYKITGKIYDANTNATLSNAVVYEINGLISATSNNNGVFSLSVPAKYEQLALSVSKNAFRDTIIFIPPENQDISVLLSPKASYVSTSRLNKITPEGNKKPETLESLPLVQRFVSDDLMIRSNNMPGITKNRLAQVSFIPTWGTNLEMSGQVNNNLSLNILAGYSHGVNGFEMGGLLNIVRADVNGVQVGGLGNLVGNNTNGVQVAGLFNHNRGSMEGAQVSGISNYLIDTLSGVQVSGINNYLQGGMDGWQVAGINNLVTQNVDGVQIAGISNITFKDVNTLQLGGILNHGRNVKGVQLAGIANHALKDIDGVQVAGIINMGTNVNALQVAGIANVALDTVYGAQLSGIINYAKYAKTTQLGLINYCDSTEGIPIGLISVVKNGFRTLELSTTEVNHLNLAFKTGVKKFYNIFTVGYGDWKGKSRWRFGYGIGTEKALGKHTLINFEYTGNWINDGEKIENELSLLNRFDIGFGYKKPNGFGFTIGPSVNLWLSESKDPETGAFSSELAPYTIIDEKIGSSLTQVWIGGKLALYW